MDMFSVFISQQVLTKARRVWGRYLGRILCIQGRLKNAYELLNLKAYEISALYKNASVNVWVRYCV